MGRGRRERVDLFVYGTLLREEVVRAITGRSFRRVSARLPGLERVSPRGSYPAAIPKRNGAVDGELLLSVDEDSLAALDRYEGEGHLYIRAAAVADCGGKPRPCQVYLPRNPLGPGATRVPAGYRQRTRA